MTAVHSLARVMSSPASSQRQAIAIAVVEHEGRFLVGVRPENVPLAGYAEFPGGKVKAAENAQAAAVRECLEETGLAVEIVEQVDATLHEYDHGKLRLLFFRCRPKHPHQPPTSPFRWVGRSELLKLSFPGANASLIDRLTSR